jgi:serine/threonine-protein kinase
MKPDPTSVTVEKRLAQPRQRAAGPPGTGPTLKYPVHSPAGLLAPGSTLAGRYRIEELIGSGGMSTVYRATDTVLARAVAVKVLLPALAEGDPTHVARFEREARAAGALRHPALVKVYDTGLDRGVHFIVMEYVAGRGLDDVLRDRAPLDPLEATQIAVQVADALAAAHSAGIQHRDIKPANVMIGPEGAVKVLDFGIARAESESTLTQGVLAIGTAAYMPPERILGRPGDERSDIYALGCLLYAMLTGRPPFVAADSVAVLHQHVHDPPPAPTALGAPIAAPLEALILRMLAKDPADRPAEASEVAARLNGGSRPPSGPLAAAASSPAMAARATTYTAGGRRPWALALIAGAAVLVLILIVTGWGGSTLHRTGVSRGKPGAAHHVRTHPARSRPPAHHTQPVTPAQQSPAPAPAPAKPAGKPPGHGGVPPGQAKKHDKPKAEPPTPPKDAGKPPKGGHGGH